MRILGSPIVPVQSPNDLRPDVTDRIQKSRTVDGARDQADDSALRAFEQQRPSNEGASRPVTASSEASERLERRVEQRPADEQLPLNARRALQAFADNTPSPEQRLGIELARIDVVV